MAGRKFSTLTSENPESLRFEQFILSMVVDTLTTPTTGG
jgi:hypothetical protein